MIIEERGELEENRVLWSLSLLVRMEACKMDWEVEELTLEHEGLIEDLDTLREHNRLLHEKGRKLKGKKIAVKRELAGTNEELSLIASECRLLQDQRATVSKT